MIPRLTVSAPLALLCVVLPPAAAQSEATAVKIVRSAGTCPVTIPIVVVTKQYEGGNTIDVTRTRE
jgi:hypothetical protein